MVGEAFRTIGRSIEHDIARTDARSRAPPLPVPRRTFKRRAEQIAVE